MHRNRFSRCGGGRFLFQSMCYQSVPIPWSFYLGHGWVPGKSPFGAPRLPAGRPVWSPFVLPPILSLFGKLALLVVQLVDSPSLYGFLLPKQAEAVSAG